MESSLSPSPSPSSDSRPSLESLPDLPLSLIMRSLRNPMDRLRLSLASPSCLRLSSGKHAEPGILGSLVIRFTPSFPPNSEGDAPPTPTPTKPLTLHDFQYDRCTDHHIGLAVSLRAVQEGGPGPLPSCLQFLGDRATALAHVAVLCDHVYAEAPVRFLVSLLRALLPSLASHGCPKDFTLFVPTLHTGNCQRWAAVFQLWSHLALHPPIPLPSPLSHHLIVNYLGDLDPATFHATDFAFLSTIYVQAQASGTVPALDHFPNALALRTLIIDSPHVPHELPSLEHAGIVYSSSDLDTIAESPPTAPSYLRLPESLRALCVTLFSLPPCGLPLLPLALRFARLEYLRICSFDLHARFQGPGEAAVTVDFPTDLPRSPRSLPLPSLKALDLDILLDLTDEVARGCRDGFSLPFPLLGLLDCPALQTLKLELNLDADPWAETVDVLAAGGGVLAQPGAGLNGGTVPASAKPPTHVPSSTLALPPVASNGGTGVTVGGSGAGLRPDVRVDLSSLLAFRHVQVVKLVFDVLDAKAGREARRPDGWGVQGTGGVSPGREGGQDDPLDSGSDAEEFPLPKLVFLEHIGRLEAAWEQGLLSGGFHRTEGVTKKFQRAQVQYGRGCEATVQKAKDESQKWERPFGRGLMRPRAQVEH